jgi:anthranilate synthase component 1
MLRLRRSAAPARAFSCSLPHEESPLDKTSFCQAVTRAKKYILEGDIFQVVLSRRSELTFAGDLFAVYRALRVINPSPYLFYIDFGASKMAGSSPEVLVRVRNSTVEVFPIAGTRRRGGTEEEDERLAAELLRDEKELAEHIMLVDLGRNDVGRIAEFGSVQVPVLKRVERYSHVMHLVSEVRGSLKAGCNALDALMACFPAGTVSGAPKVRAMEIIHELEPCPRGAYAGAVGYLGLNGALDTCIAIRTIIAHHDRMRIQAGAGIVADSVPEQEFQETVNKAQALLDAVRLAASGLSASLVGRRGGGGAS